MSSGFEVGQEVRHKACIGREVVRKVLWTDGTYFLGYPYNDPANCPCPAMCEDWEPIPEEPAAPVFQVGDIVWNCVEGREEPAQYSGPIIKVDDEQFISYTPFEERPSGQAVGECHADAAILLYRPQEQKPDLYEWLPSVDDLNWFTTRFERGIPGAIELTALLRECIKRRSGQ